MRDAKAATVMSGLSPLAGSGRPPKGSPLPSVHAPTTAPGVGERMRRETGSALEQALTKGKLAALTHYGLKAAAAPLPVARAFTGRGAAAAGGGTNGGILNGSGVQQFMRPVKRGLGLAAIGATGAAAYGLHQQNARDQEGRDLVYAPLGGV